MTLETNEIKEGQIWTYKCRQGEEGSRLTIFKIDFFDGKCIIHLTIDGLVIKNKDFGDIVANSVGHLPITFDAFKKSVLYLEGLVDASFNEGYLIWKEAYRNGTAGIYSAEISEVIAMIEDTCNS